MIEIIRKANLNSVTILLLVMAFIHPLLYWGELRDASSLPRYALLGVISAVGLIVWLINIYKKEKYIFVHFIYIPVIIFFLWSLLSISWSVDPKNAVIEIIQFFGLILIAFLMSQVVTRDRLILIAIVSTVSASIVSLIGIQQYFYFNPFNFVQYSQPGSTFTVTNLVSIYLDLIVPVAFMIFITSKSKYIQWLFAVCFSLCFSFLLLSRTRGSWLGILCATLLFLILLYKNPWLKEMFFLNIKNKKLLILLSLLLPVILLNISGGTYKGGYSKFKYDASAGIRMTAYVNSLSMIKDKPLLGTGLGGFRIGFRPYMFANLPLTQADIDINLLRLHNDPLQFIVELGIPIGILISFVAVFMMLLIWQVIKIEKTDGGQLIFIGVFLSLLASGVHSLVDFPIRKPSSAIQLSLWLGAFIGLYRQNFKSNKIFVTKFIFSSLLILSIGYGIVVLIFYSKYIESNVYLKQAQINYFKKDCDQAKKQIKIGNDIFGLDYLSQSRLVQMYSFCGSSDVEKIKVMTSAIEYDFSNTRARLTRGHVYLSIGQLNSAKNDFEVIVRILPNRASGYIGLGDVATLDKKYKVAEKYYLEALLKLNNKTVIPVRKIKNVKNRLKNIESYLQ